VVPFALVAAETNVGVRVSTVELLVTEVAEILPTSLPIESCTAAFDVDESDDGAVYANVTVSPR